MSSDDSTLQAPASKALKLLQGMNVVDVDVHINDRPQALLPYCELPWRKTLEHLAKLPQRYLDIPSYAPSINPWPSFPQGTGARRMQVNSADQLRKDLDQLGVNVGLLFPDHLLLLATLKRSEYAVAVARAYNRWLVEEWLSGDLGLKGAIIVPPQDPAAAAVEIRGYAAQRHVAAIFLPTSCVEPLYGSRFYDPIFEAAQETGLPLFFHSVTMVHPNFPFNLHGFETSFGAHVVAHPFSLVANLVSLVETGVVARFPGLRFAFSEGGVGWVPWIMLRLDKEYSERRRDVPFLRDRPSIYIKQMMFFASQPVEEPENMSKLATLIDLFDGDHSVMFASDWPHHDFDHPTKLMQVPLSPDARRRVMGGNAARLLRLGVSP